MRIEFTVRMSDLYWMWLTSWFTPATVAFGLFFVSAFFVPGNHPRDLDLACGLGLIVAAFTVAPVYWMSITGMRRLIGQSVELQVDEDGVSGWPIAIAGGRAWGRLRKPRIEALVVVLPFRNATSPRGWVVIPRRAVTDAQLGELVALMRAHGFLARGDGRSVTGQLLAPFVRGPGQP